MKERFAAKNHPRYEVSDIFQMYGKEYLRHNRITSKQHKVMNAIECCRTSELGYHVDRCDNCGHTEPEFNSCRDRHCPKCQGVARKKWIQARIKNLLPVSYYHVVFTLPHSLHPLLSHNKEFFYNLLFSSASDTLLSFGRDPRWLGGELGFYGILHSWGQTILRHVHVHFIVPGGALTPDLRWIEPRHKARFLFPVRALSEVFRAKFIEGLQGEYNSGDLSIPSSHEYFKSKKEFDHFIEDLFRTKWVVYCKSPFGNSLGVVKYIGRYTHRVAISNSRIISVDHSEIRFRYKQYKGKKIVWDKLTLTAHEFIRRFLWHVLPESFHKIRHYGFMANGRCRTKISQILSILQSRTNDPLNSMEESEYVRTCPECKKGRLNPLLVINRFGKTLVSPFTFFKNGYAFDTS
jgi:putative transposase/transposase-like zinc-binding protein